MGIRRNKVLYDASAAGTGSWVRIDARYEQNPERAIQVDMTSGDTITIEGTTKDQRGATSMITIDTDDITTLNTFTASGNGVLSGNWTYIRAKKVGTAGAAKVQGFV